MKVEMGFFKCMESMARDMRHPYIPSTTVLGDSLYILTPEAVCCCLQTCKCCFDIRVVLCTSVPSLIVRNANTSKL